MGGKKFEKRGMIAFAGEEQTFSEEGKKIRDRFASKEFFFGRNKWREGGEVVWKKIRDLFESKLRVSNRCCDLKCMYFARDNGGRGWLSGEKEKFGEREKGKIGFEMFVWIERIRGNYPNRDEKFFFENKNANLGEDCSGEGISRLFV